jgi:hypothetical protein
LRENATSIVRPNRTAVVGTVNATVMSTPTFHSTTGIVSNIKKLSIIDDEKTKEITTVHVAVVFHVVKNHINLHKL